MMAGLMGTVITETNPPLYLNKIMTLKCLKGKTVYKKRQKDKDA